MAIAYSQTREQFPLSTSKVLKKTIAASVLWLVLIFTVLPVLAILSAAVEETALIIVGSILILGISIIAIILTYLYQRWYHEVYFYDLTPDYIVIRKGPITPHEITIPYERLQDIYVDQDILDRLFGIYDVHLSSATISSGMAAHIDGVEKPAADGLRDMLMKTVNERISKNRMPLQPQA